MVGDGSLAKQMTDIEKELQTKWDERHHPLCAWQYLDKSYRYTIMRDYKKLLKLEEEIGDIKRRLFLS
jgi:hypothetical protein